MDKRSHAYTLSSTTACSISDLRDQFLEYGTEVAEHSTNTTPTRRSHLKFFVDFCSRNNIISLNDLNNIIIDEFFVEYRKTREKSTVNTCKRTIKAFLRWIDGYKEVSTYAKPDAIKLVREKKKLPQAIDDIITAKVIKEAEVQQDSLIIATFRESGMRPCELVNVRVEDIMIADSQLRVTESKDDEERFVNITPELAQKLQEFAKAEHRQPYEFLFQNVYKGYGAQMTVKTVWRRVQKCYAEIAGVHVYPRQLRHAAAIGLLREGCDLVTIKNQLGHEDIETTMVYLRISNEYFKESYAKSMKRSILSY